MLVVDSSAWIEELVGSPLSTQLKALFPPRARWIVPTMVQLELAKWLLRELGEVEADRMLAFTEKCILVPMDSTIALRAADLCVRHKLSTADAVIYATALERGAGLLTCDAHFAGLPGVTFMAKGGLN